MKIRKTRIRALKPGAGRKRGKEAEKEKKGEKKEKGERGAPFLSIGTAFIEMHTCLEPNTPVLPTAAPPCAARLGFMSGFTFLMTNLTVTNSYQLHDAIILPWLHQLALGLLLMQLVVAKCDRVPPAPCRHNNLALNTLYVLDAWC